MEATMLAGLTAEQIRDACDTLYRPTGYTHAPAQVFLDQFEAADPPTTFLRVAFSRFTSRAARMLTQLGAILQERHGARANIVFVVYFDRIDKQRIVADSIRMEDR
jgi:hypothetical protein